MPATFSEQVDPAFWHRCRQHSVAQRFHNEEAFELGRQHLDQHCEFQVHDELIALQGVASYKFATVSIYFFARRSTLYCRPFHL